MSPLCINFGAAVFYKCRHITITQIVKKQVKSLRLVRWLHDEASSSPNFLNQGSSEICFHIICVTDRRQIDKVTDRVYTQSYKRQFTFRTNKNLYIHENAKVENFKLLLYEQRRKQKCNIKMYSNSHPIKCVFMSC